MTRPNVDTFRVLVFHALNLRDASLSLDELEKTAHLYGPHHEGHNLDWDATLDWVRFLVDLTRREDHGPSTDLGQIEVITAQGFVREPDHATLTARGR